MREYGREENERRGLHRDVLSLGNRIDDGIGSAVFLLVQPLLQGDDEQSREGRQENELRVLFPICDSEVNALPEQHADQADCETCDNRVD